MSAFNRRELLLNLMETLESQGMGCIGCKGTCCTFEANSMLVTPLEALDLYSYLHRQNLLTVELKARLEENVKQYRLEPKFTGARRSYLRKTYTCPFFGHQELGCPLPRNVKPYGCLAFDSHHVELKASEHCYSEKEILEERERRHPEEYAINEELRRKFSLLWEKAPIANALLDFWSKEVDSQDS